MVILAQYIKSIREFNMRLFKKISVVIIVIICTLHLAGNKHVQYIMPTGIIPAGIKLTGGAVAEAAAKESSKTKDTNDYNIFFLDKDAKIKKYLANGVYWVSVNTLGGPQLTDKKIIDLINKQDPKSMSKSIDTLYDVVRYYYLAGFKTLSSDHKDIPFNGVYWQHHKTGPEALITNCGDCSGNAVLAAYLLAGDYDEVGYITYNIENGSGHVFNYIKQDGKYYFTDFSSNRDAIREDTKRTWQGAYYPANLVMADSVEKFVSYYKTNFLNGAKAVFSTYTADRVAPVGYKNGKYYLPDDIEDLKFYGDTDRIKFVLTKRPVVIPSWNEEGFIDRSIKAEVAVVPYSYKEYHGSNIGIEVRIYPINDITVEIQQYTAKYYAKNGRLLYTEDYDEGMLGNMHPNNCIFTMRPCPLHYDSNCAYVEGKVVLKDIHGNTITEEFIYQMN
jgi:hypothetical protein